jgi:hypothetical protein
MSPILAVELARRSIPSEVRPSFKEMETTCRNSGKAPPAGAPPGKDAAKPAAGKAA